MSITSTVKYLGGLRTECTHLASGDTIITDAPVDNKGQGAAFSPTDLCATALASCATTIMGIYAEAHDVDIEGLRAEVTKHMGTDTPRRIARIDVIFYMPDKNYSDKEKKSLERAALTCPVHHSLSEAIEQNISFKWHD